MQTLGAIKTPRQQQMKHTGDICLNADECAGFTYFVKVEVKPR